MSDLQFYLANADPETALIIRQQYASAVERNSVRCPCGLPRALHHAFKCLYCGVWFCFSCAEAHFGQTFQDRLSKRKPVENTAAGENCSSADSISVVSK